MIWGGAFDFLEKKRGNFRHAGRPGKRGGSLPSGVYGGKYAASGVVGQYNGRPILKGELGMSAQKTDAEARRVAPLLEKVGQAWRRSVLALDPKAKIEIRGTFSYLTSTKLPEMLTSAWIELDGETKGSLFGIGITLHPGADGNTIKMNDSSLPNSLKKRGVFSSGLKVLMNPQFNLNGKMSVHHSSNDRAWGTIARHFGLNWKEWQNAKYVNVPDKDLTLFRKE